MQTLPKDIRRQLIPAAETTAAAYELLEVADEPLAVALARAVEAVVPSVRVPPRAFDATRVPDHLRITFAVHDDDRCRGRHRQGPRRGQAPVAGDASAAVARATPVDERRGITTWDVGDLPRRIDTVRGGHTVHGYPALLDDGDSVSLRVFTTRRTAGAGDARWREAPAVAGRARRQASGGSASHQSRQADARPIRAADCRRHRCRLHRSCRRPVGRRARRGVDRRPVRRAGRRPPGPDCRRDRRSPCAPPPRSSPSPPTSRST